MNQKCKLNMKAVLLLFLLVSNSLAVELLAIDEEFYRAIGKVESNNNDRAIGRAGEIGRYQISYSYWHDASRYAKIEGKWEDCFDNNYSRKIITAYLNLYGKGYIQAKDYQRLARIHNGGPYGFKYKNTYVYWKKTKKYL